MVRGYQQKLDRFSFNHFEAEKEFQSGIFDFCLCHSRRVLQLQIVAPSLGSRAGFWMKLQATQAG